jgi:predicted DNA-binding transcriptional regulator YafY
MPVETRKAHPLHILCLDHIWYLFLWDTDRRDIRTFMLSRMRSITRTGRKFRPRKFNLEEAIAKRFLITSGDPVAVKIHFRRKASYLVVERPAHHTQKLAPGPNTEWNLELTLEAAHTPELERWILGYGEDAIVIEPPALRDAIARKVSKHRRELRTACLSPFPIPNSHFPQSPRTV